MTSSKSPLRYLVTGAGVQMITLVVSAVIGFMLTPLMIHTLGDHDYGILALVGSFTGWLGLMDLGLSGAVTRFVAINYSKGDNDESLAYSSTGFFLYLGLGMAAFLVAAIATFALPWLMSRPAEIPLIRMLVLLSAAAFAIEMPLRALAGMVNGYMRRDITGAIMLVGRLLRAGATVAILLLGGRLISLTLGGLLIGVLMFAVWWYTSRRVIPGFFISPQFISREKLRSLFSFGGISFIGNLAESVISRIDGFVIAWFIAVAAVPQYVIATTLVSYFRMTIMTLTNWLMNWFAHKETAGKAAMAESLYLSNRYIVIVSGFCLFGLISFGKPFIERWMGPNYLEAYPCMVALAISEFLRAIQRPNVNLLLMQARHHLFTYAKVIEAIINLVFSIALVQRFGILGVALGTMIASIIVNGILFPIVFCLAADINPRQYGKALLHGMIVVVLLTTAPAYLIAANATPSYSTLILCGILSASFYFPFAIVLGTTSSERRRLVAAYLR